MLTRNKLEAVQAEVKTLGDKLDAFEREVTDSRVEKLQQAQDALTVKVSELAGGAKAINLVLSVIAIVFALLSVMSGYNIYQYGQFEAIRGEAYEVLVASFEDKLADTIDRISFIDPTNEQVYKFAELSRMQKHLQRTGVVSARFQARSDLTDAVELLIIYNKPDEALSKLRSIKLQTTSTDRFVEARVLTLEALILVRPNRKCDNPDAAIQVEDALDKDGGVGAAYNIKGLCLTDEAQKTARDAKSEDDFKNGAALLQKGMSYYDLAYTLKPTDLTMARRLNNKVSAYLFFFNEVFNGKVKVDVDRVLDDTSYHDFKAFVRESLRELELSQQLIPEQSAYWETEAELHFLEHMYYTSKSQPEEADKALKKEREKFKEAIKKGLYRKMASFDDAINDLKKNDPLLNNLAGDAEILDLIKATVGGR